VHAALYVKQKDQLICNLYQWAILSGAEYKIRTTHWTTRRSI